jgi:hypothetical protein
MRRGLAWQMHHDAGMSEQTLRRTGSMVDMQSTMPWLVAVGVYVLLLTLGPKLLFDPDTYSHIALGRWILETAQSRQLIRFQQTSVGHLGSRSSGSRKSHLQQHTRQAAGLVLSLWQPPRLQRLSVC